MEKFNQDFLRKMKSKLDVELLGVASVKGSNSKELKERALSLLPGAKSVIVFGKEIYKEVVSLLKSSKEAGEAENCESHHTIFSRRDPCCQPKLK